MFIYTTYIVQKYVRVIIVLLWTLILALGIGEGMRGVKRGVPFMVVSTPYQNQLVSALAQHSWVGGIIFYFYFIPSQQSITDYECEILSGNRYMQIMKMQYTLSTRNSVKISLFGRRTIFILHTCMYVIVMFRVTPELQ